ncbi:P-loop NTPase fold protein [uncultured Thomasclavelia sp.]|uniref:KAP family P-loop NTPase fold protein n=1 Tax=uncultured Thomasclavelia sp. TaxID=3025759 RepID=UPI00261CEE97|nr:P-loop NTPase fold protein [uncultured Thomasclavelia sp.]
MREQKNTNTNEIDILGRNQFVDNCKLLIDAIFDTTKSAFIMIDGEWGVGKTFVMNMLDKKLKKNYSVIKYNCWENSYYNDPMEAILSVMLDYIDKGSLWSNADKERFKVLGKVALNLLSLGSVNILNKFIDEIREYINEDNKNIYTVIQEVKDYINSNEEKIIILVDEIDRCLPKYGIKTLERLYLLFKDMPNIVVIVANDKSKLEKSIKNTFGYDVTDNYLEKFIDYVINLSSDFTIRDDNQLYIKYIVFNNYLTIDTYGNNLKDCVLLNIIFEYLISTKKMRYIDKTIKIHSNIHKLVFGEKKTLPLYVFIVELLMIEFSKKIEVFTLENIMNYIKNTDFKDRLISYFDFLYYHNNNDFNHSIEDSELRWIDILKKVCTSEDEKKVILFFQFIDKLYSVNFLLNKKNAMFEFHRLFYNNYLKKETNKYFKNFQFGLILSNNPGTYDDIEEYLQKLIDFYWIFNFIEPI